MEILILAEKATIDFDPLTLTLKIITAPLVAVIITQEDSIPAKELTKQVRNEKMQQISVMQKQHHKLVENQLDDNSKRALKQKSEKGASSWLNILPLKEHGFDWNKDEFSDAITLRCNMNISSLPSKCFCSNNFDLNHAMNCKNGVFLVSDKINLEISKQI